MLINENRYVENERGYIFEDPKVERFFGITKLWGWKIRDILSKSYLIELFRQNGNINSYDEVVRINREFMTVDIDFVISVCHILNNESCTEEQVTDIITHYLEKVNKIKQKYIVIENHL